MQTELARIHRRRHDVRVRDPRPEEALDGDRIAICPAAGPPAGRAGSTTDRQSLVANFVGDANFLGGSITRDGAIDIPAGRRPRSRSGDTVEVRSLMVRPEFLKLGSPDGTDDAGRPRGGHRAGPPGTGRQCRLSGQPRGSPWRPPWGAGRRPTARDEGSATTHNAVGEVAYGGWQRTRH
jgi:hypothetical protein